MTLGDAARTGVARLRLIEWADPHAYLRLDLFDDGTHGPWAHLYDRNTQQAIGEPTPQALLFLQVSGHSDFVEYSGPLDESDTARAVESGR